MSAEYPTPEEAFGPGERRRIDRYDALRDARSEARYEPDNGEPDTRGEVAEAAYMPLEGAVSPSERLYGDG